MHYLPEPYLLFLGDVADPYAIKLARGVHSFRPEKCVGQLVLSGATVLLEGLPQLSINEAVSQGAQTFVIGVANSGGFIPESWIPVIVEAIEAGMHIASGMHIALMSIPVIAKAATGKGNILHDIRLADEDPPIGTGEKRTGKRLLTVGTDCSSGKMYTSLVLEQALQERKVKTKFVATGQAGILIAGEGIAVDNVKSDFISGAVESLSPATDPDQWDIIEGQGSLYHPSYAGVSLGLLHGAQADALIMCHVPTRNHVRHLPDYPTPSIEECIKLNLELASLTNPNVQCIGVSANTSEMTEEEASKWCQEMAAKLNLPVVDPLRHGVNSLVEALLCVK